VKHVAKAPSPELQGLGLIDVGPPICCHVQDDLLLDLPDRLIEFLRPWERIPMGKDCGFLTVLKLVHEKKKIGDMGMGQNPGT